MAKILANRLKPILSNHISLEQFAFLENRQIHDAIGIAQEGLHSMHTKRIKGMVLNIDLAKAFDQVSWLYIRMLLTHLGFPLQTINWIMCSITIVSYSILINGTATNFFHAEWGLRQGCPLSPILFLLVMEGLSRCIIDETSRGRLKGICLTTNCVLTHLLFVDDIILFPNGTLSDTSVVRAIMLLFCKTMGM